MPPKKKAKKKGTTMSQNVKQSVVVHVNTTKTTKRRQPTRGGNRSQPMSRIQTPQFVGVVGQDYSTYNNQLNNITQAIANAIKQPDRTGNLITTPPRQAPDQPIHNINDIRVQKEEQRMMANEDINVQILRKPSPPNSPLSDKSSSYTPSSPPPNLAPQPKEESKVKASQPNKSLNENVDELSEGSWDSRRAEEQPKLTKKQLKSEAKQQERERIAQINREENEKERLKKQMSQLPIRKTRKDKGQTRGSYQPRNYKK
jgi:hypothetical protein